MAEIARWAHLAAALDPQEVVALRVAAGGGLDVMFPGGTEGRIVDPASVARALAAIGEERPLPEIAVGTMWVKSITIQTLALPALKAGEPTVAHIARSAGFTLVAAEFPFIAEC